MSLSSSCLIHLTKSKKALVGILTDNFRIKYCREEITTPDGTFAYGIPMVSFCDIPIAQLKDHIKKYGSYGIGLSQEWGSQNGLNPVFYIDKQSSVGRNYHQVLLDLFQGKSISKTSDHDARLLDVLRYMKNYEADLLRGGKVKKDYRFADEKEWRYVPTKEQCTIMVPGKAFSQPAVKKAYNEEASSLRLVFEPKHIKYIVVKDDSEVKEFLQVLRSTKGKYSFDDVERLTTRLITVEQIMADF